jgi:hypothetical protein
MYRTPIVLFVIVLLCLFTAHASELSTNVMRYNEKASKLQQLHDEFWVLHDAAYTSACQAFEGLYGYVASEDDSTADVEYAKYTTATSELQGIATKLQNAFTEYHNAIRSAGNDLINIIELDQASVSEDVFVDGPPLFTLTATPFPFWRDSTCPDIHENPSFTFPNLGITTPGNNPRYQGDGLYQLMQGALDPGSWSNFQDWSQSVRDRAAQLNNPLALDYDALTEYCTADNVTSLYWQRYLHGRGYSDADMAAWCAAMCDPDTPIADLNDSPSDKAKEVRRRYKRKMHGDLQTILDDIQRWVEGQYINGIHVSHDPEAV